MDELHYNIKIKLTKEDTFIGPGVSNLLKLTEKFESLNAAAKSMHLSYSKAFKMIKAAEKILGFNLLDKKIGGANGGGSKIIKKVSLTNLKKTAGYL
ncbi:MAG: winged helix-turn-helix domain-containing protein [Sedimentibacter sp.]